MSSVDQEGWEDKDSRGGSESDEEDNRDGVGDASSENQSRPWECDLARPVAWPGMRTGTRVKKAKSWEEFPVPSDEGGVERKNPIAITATGRPHPFVHLTRRHVVASSVQSGTEQPTLPNSSSLHRVRSLNPSHPWALYCFHFIVTPPTQGKELAPSKTVIRFVSTVIAFPASTLLRPYHAVRHQVFGLPSEDGRAHIPSEEQPTPTAILGAPITDSQPYESTMASADIHPTRMCAQLRIRDTVERATHTCRCEDQVSHSDGIPEEQDFDQSAREET